MQTHDHLKPSLLSTIFDMVSAYATLMPPRQRLGISPKADGQNWTGFGSLCPVLFTISQQALCSLVPSYVLNCPMGQMPHCMVWKPVCWAVALPTPYVICFEHKTTATPPRTVLQAMDQASEVIIRLVHLQIDCLFYQSQAATSKQQRMEQSAEPGEQTVCLQAAGLERSLATLAASCVWCKTQSRLTPDLTQHLQAAEHRAGWKCQLGSALAQRCLQSVSWAGLQCSG